MAETITHADWISTKELAAKIESALAAEYIDPRLRGQYELFFESLLEKINEENDSSLSFAEITTNETAYEYLTWVATKGFTYGVWAGVGTKHYVALLEILAKKRYYVNYYENFAWAQEVELTGEEEAEELAEEEE
eukprot:gene32023-40458_t